MTALAGAATPMSREHAGLWGGRTARSYLHAPNPHPTLGHCGKSPLFGAGQKRARLFDLVRFVIPFHTAVTSGPFHGAGVEHATPRRLNTRGRRERVRGAPGAPRPPGRAHLSAVTRMRSSLDDCCSSSFSWKCSCTHCSSNSCSRFSSSSPRNSSARGRSARP